ncbi:hypothetical protein [Brumimicrobium sp.]|uniref:hypothetical protein n=1 Tax=Brumimicrobium sp. TaxID=2029867 RepID=UPI003A8FCD73
MKEIQKVIAEIEMKVAKMRTALMHVRTENDSLKTEVRQLHEKLSQREQEVQDFQKKYDILKHQQEQSQLVVNSQKDNGAQIDALVREIDDCIGRLKA